MKVLSDPNGSAVLQDEEQAWTTEEMLELSELKLFQKCLVKKTAHVFPLPVPFHKDKMNIAIKIRKKRTV